MPNKKITRKRISPNLERERCEWEKEFKVSKRRIDDEIAKEMEKARKGKVKKRLEDWRFRV